MTLPPHMQKYWAPLGTIRDYLELKCRAYTRIVEVQPGSVPIPFATDRIDYSVDKIDLDTTVLAYPDQSFDFLYCRHVLEDLQNPDFAFREMARISQNGFVETPSPLVECTRNVDTGPLASFYCGYNHHRYVTWTESATNTLCFLPKMPIIEHVNFELSSDTLARLADPYMWNNYYEWNPDQPARYKIYKSGLDFSALHDYVPLLNHAIEESIKTTTVFRSIWKV